MSASHSVDPQTLAAQTPGNRHDSKGKLREIFVPFEDLEVLLQGDLQRVFMTRQQYEDLLRRAQQSPERAAPHAASLLSAAYQIQIDDGRAHQARPGTRSGLLAESRQPGALPKHLGRAD